MPRPCSVCEHPKRSDIDTALARSNGYRAVARQFGVSADATCRHKRQHLRKALLAHKKISAAIKAATVFDRIQKLIVECEQIKEETIKSRDYRAALGAIDKLETLIKFLLQLEREGAIQEAGQQRVAKIEYVNDWRPKALPPPTIDAEIVEE